MTAAPSSSLLPHVPVLVSRAGAGVLLTPDGEVVEGDPATLRDALEGAHPMVCHRPRTLTWLGLEGQRAFDVLELFAFVRPATFCVPTVGGLCRALGLAAPASLLDEATALAQVAQVLLQEATQVHGRARDTLVALTTALLQVWGWAGPLLRALDATPAESRDARRALRLWEVLPEWEERAPRSPPGLSPVSADAAVARLERLLGADQEPRPAQRTYTAAVAAAFDPPDTEDAPAVVLAEAGTGTGKTLGYLAPASVWSEANAGAVWISTFTRNLQAQVEREAARLGDPQRVAVRMGRENYLCLLNLADAVTATAPDTAPLVALGLMIRWAGATRTGALVGGDFPGWLADLLGRNRTFSLTDKRGECVYAACDHYRRCFVERSIRAARDADVVIANHALMLVQAALGGLDDGRPPARMILDEGHHLFGAADSAFSARLTGQDAAELRRWLLGPEGRERSRARGLDRRCRDLLTEDEAALAALDAVMEAARILPRGDWMARLTAAAPLGPLETFLSAVRDHVHARVAETDGPYSLECPTAPASAALLEAAARLRNALEAVLAPLRVLAKTLHHKLDDEAATLDTEARQRLMGLTRSLTHRAILPLAAWQAMLDALASEARPEYVDRCIIERSDGRAWDVGLVRHWVDPTLPLAEALLAPAQGVLITSATLRDVAGEQADEGWDAAKARTGLLHLSTVPRTLSVASPFAYAEAARVLVVRDVRKDDLFQVGAAFRELFLAAGGGALGIFTAVARLKAVHGALADALDAQGLPLLAQHVDAMDMGTLIDVFREQRNACLLGTDAVRDGVDVPGDSLRLIVFDRVPWPRPDILHRHRRAVFGGRTYDDALTRLRLKQAFGRLIRREGDRGVFVILDPMLPSRLLDAFPPGVAVDRVGLAEAVAATAAWLDPATAGTP